ncbi:MAG: phosphatidylserine decarboxylase, partial [Planctomycetota bacterium]|nr:phosphatidylserine decarboxylase [Planctomycetota bacterium]
MMRFLKLAEYGADEFVLATVACAAAAVALRLLNPWLALLPLLPYAIVVWFFRDPERQGPDAADVLLAPADGTVADIQEVEEPEFVGGKALRIGIFLSPFSVHVNRAPCRGTVQFVTYKAGEFLPAYNPDAPVRNESVTLGLVTDAGLRLLVKQISGVLARRVVCAVRPGDALARGQRYGMIKLGSRTELYIPAGAVAACAVAVGSKVKGGLSPCCR